MLNYAPLSFFAQHLHLDSRFVMIFDFVIFLKKYGFRQKTRIFSKSYEKTIAKNAIYHSGGPKKPFEAIKFALARGFFFFEKLVKI